MSCPSATSCFAVGSRAVADLSATTASLVEHWSGDHWSVLPSPNPPGAQFVNLRAVDCPNTKSCFAVGDSQDNNCFAVGSDNLTRALIEHWNGSPVGPSGTAGTETSKT